MTVKPESTVLTYEHIFTKYIVSYGSLLNNVFFVISNFYCFNKETDKTHTIEKGYNIAQLNKKANLTADTDWMKEN